MNDQERVENLGGSGGGSSVGVDSVSGENVGRNVDGEKSLLKQGRRLDERLSDGLDDKKMMIELALSRLEEMELRQLLGLLTDTDLSPSINKIKCLRAIRNLLDEVSDEVEIIELIRKLIIFVPPRLASSISSILQSGIDPNPMSTSASTTEVKAIPQLDVADLMKTSAFRKDFRIDGKLGRGKDHINIITLKGQIEDGKRKGYTEEEICAAVKRAIAPGEMKTILDSMTTISLDQVMTFVESFLKEKSSSELFQTLSLVYQNENEDPQAFLMRLMELRQKCLLVSRKPGEVPYSHDLVQTMFLKRLRIGLTSNEIKTRLERFIEQQGTEDIEDSLLIQTINKIASEEAERECLRMGNNKVVGQTLGSDKSGSNRKLAISAATLSNPNTTADNQMNLTVQKLAQQVTELTQAVQNLHQASNSKNSGQSAASQSKSNGGGSAQKYPMNRRQWYSCEACTAANKPRACKHCWECGSSDHQVRDCPSSN